MSVKTDPSGRRSVQLEFEVPGTPEQVWQAIATGPGISSWFVPSEVEEREGGAIAFHLGAGMDSAGVVTAWEPPRRFAYEERDWAPGAPPLATEFIVETRSGGTCAVRLVHSLFAAGDDWDDQMEGFESGWPPFFDVLRLVLTHFQGQRCSPLRLLRPVPGPEPEAWDALTRAFGLEGASEGQRWKAPASGAPPLAGAVERTGKGKNLHEILLRLDEPAPGVALIGVYSWGGQVHAALSFFFFGDRGPAAARGERSWNAWLSELFVPAGLAAKEPS